MGSTLFGFDHFGGGGGSGDKDDRTNKDKKETPTDENKKLPIINPLVRLPNWPSK